MLRHDRFGAMMKSGVSWRSSVTVVCTRCAGVLCCWNLSWFSAVDIIKNIKYACNRTFTMVYGWQKLSLVWRSYCKNKMVQFFWLPWCVCVCVRSVVSLQHVSGCLPVCAVQRRHCSCWWCYCWERHGYCRSSSTVTMLLTAAAWTTSYGHSTASLRIQTVHRRSEWRVVTDVWHAQSHKRLTLQMMLNWLQFEHTYVGSQTCLCGRTS